MSVKIKDREKSVEYLRLALVMAEIGIDYETCELIKKMNSEVTRLKGSFTVDDASRIKAEWVERWESYHKKQKL